MNATLDRMATPRKKKPDGSASSKAGRFPSRDKVKYAGIPANYWDMLESMTGEGGKYEQRSVAYLTTIAVRAFLKAEGKIDDAGKPVA